MAETKLLDMIPENLREPLIEEIKEMLAGEKVDRVAEDKKVVESIKAWSEKTNPKPKGA